jgi:PTH1 family peptidyl-tRNA hydrolase
MKAETINSPFLIVGLGNPGRRFIDNRHNIGFMVVNALAQAMELQFTRTHRKALITEGRFNGCRVILAKPQTFMNRSGESVASLKRYYRINATHLLVVFDDLDLPLGTIRLRPQGGSGGHRGIRSIIERIGTDVFPRMRLGIGRPPGNLEPADYVLQSFSSEERPLVELILGRAVECIHTYIRHGIETAMNRFNTNIEDI